MLDPQERSELLTPSRSGENGLDNYMQLSSDEFNLISKWHYFAILNLLDTKNFKSDCAWIASRLGLSVKKIHSSIESLKRLKLVKENADGTLKRTKHRYRTTDDVNNVALRKSHHETLQLAQTILEREPVDLRDYTWLTLPFDLKKMPKAKEMIRKFQDDFLEMVEEDAQSEEVYRLAIQLFPLTKLNNKTKK